MEMQVKITPNNPPRKFVVGSGDAQQELSDCGQVELSPGEMLTFTADGGARHDVTRKEWGFYATASMNSRLAATGLRSALVINPLGRMFVMLVEFGKEKEFSDYLSRDGQRVLTWLDNDVDVQRVAKLLGVDVAEVAAAVSSAGGKALRSVPGERPKVFRPCPMCGGVDIRVQFVYPSPPPGEFHYKFTENFEYWREIHRCGHCGHWFEWHQMDQSSFYTGDYVSATYGEAAKIKAAFDKINSLAEDRSDNVGRVRRILDFASGYFAKNRFAARVPRSLDVGSGLCVFGWRMKQAGWDVSTVDLDQRLVDHARNVVGVNAMLGDIRTMDDIGVFDLISFNKVLEHVESPIELLASVRRRLAGGGLVYVELPDGDGAMVDGQDREEYLLGHIHVFSMASTAMLIERAGFELLSLERLREPSTKFTIRAFARADQKADHGA